MSKRRVVITGLGLLTPVGNTVEESWKNIAAGKSGIAEITAFDASKFSARISGSVKDFDADMYLSRKDQRKMDTFIHYGIAAGIQALEDSGIEVTDENAERIGVAIGSGIGGLPFIEKSCDAYAAGGPRWGCLRLQPLRRPTPRRRADRKMGCRQCRFRWLYRTASCGRSAE